MQVLILSPEPPYPLNSGGAFRTASLLHYFARFAQVDLILISESGAPALLPQGLVRSQKVIPLPRHNRGAIARYVRNASRALRRVPPLIDRLSGLSAPIERAIQELIGNEGRVYDFGIVEHFWGAPYVDQLSSCCKRTVINLHNIESVLHNRYSGSGNGFSNGVSNVIGEQLIRAGQRRFAAASRKLESDLLPRYSAVLTTSEHDASLVRAIAPRAHVHVYPNSLPWTDLPKEDAPRVDVPSGREYPRLVFSANFEYHPNIDAVAFLVGEIWPKIRMLLRLKKAHPELRLRLVGRGDRSIRHLLPSGPVEKTGIEVTGPVEDARAEIAQATHRRGSSAGGQRNPSSRFSKRGLPLAASLQHPWPRKDSAPGMESISRWRPMQPDWRPQSSGCWTIAPAGNGSQPAGAVLSKTIIPGNPHGKASILICNLRINRDLTDILRASDALRC